MTADKQSLGPAPIESTHPAAMPPERLLAECDVRFVRRGGPGGQHRNKVSTAAILTHQPTGISAEANERRSQSENRTAALFRLRINLALECRRRLPSPNSPCVNVKSASGDASHKLASGDASHKLASGDASHKLASGDASYKSASGDASYKLHPQVPSDLWRSRCRDGVIAVNPSHDDFPALLAEALDALDADEYDMRSSAGRFGCTASQLVKLLSKEPRAMAAVNAQRRERGLRPLR